MMVQGHSETVCVLAVVLFWCCLITKNNQSGRYGFLCTHLAGNIAQQTLVPSSDWLLLTLFCFTLMSIDKIITTFGLVTLLFDYVTHV